MRQTLIAYAATLAAILALPSSTDAGLFGKDRVGPTEVDVSYTFRMRHYGATGSGCAVNGMTLTNRHMVDPRSAADFSIPHKVRFRYSFTDGVTEGRGYSRLISNHADLATVVLDKEPPFGYAKLAAEPKPGDDVFWVEYDWRKQDDMYALRGRKSKVLRTLLGVAILKDPPSRGASGGCAYNVYGEVLGIMAFYQSGDDGKPVGGVEGFWGHWWEDLVSK